MNGLLIIDKPKDCTSRDVVNSIEKIFNTKKVGHAGTLDPIATGVLVIAIGTGLKILEFINNDDKEYIATVKMGLKTDTLDVTGKVLEEQDNFSLDKDKLKEVLNSFIGKQIQEVPIYSSVKVDGERLYKYARENIEVTLPKREIEIFDIELIDSNEEEFSFKAKVSKGTYIRSLIRDIGDKLNILCTMKELKRTKQGKFNIEEASTLEDLEKGKYNLIPIDKALDNIKFIDADNYLENRIMNGSILDNRYEDKIIGFKNKDGNVIALYEVYEKDNKKVKPIKVFKES